ncbi:MAG TPA: sigma-54 dependent transcriptional regulator [Rubrivivax sp.]|nr:sigma-54 dependent transcriptional regulator [Rubrivivax sp.]
MKAGAAREGEADGVPVDRLIIGRSALHLQTMAQLARIAASEAPVLIEGETGSGKELAARAIHYGGARRHAPFVPVNCGALPDTLIESELFGVQRGAFTDARQSRCGLVAEATGGTLFLDEVDALSAKAQVTLLRFLQDQRFRPVGTAREQRTDVRIVAASNRPLDALVARQWFRSDLLYRLKILHLLLAPLRERADDVEPLAEHFVARFAAKYGCEPRSIHPATRAWLRVHPWPGNVRELENWVHRQFLMCPGEALHHELPQAPVPDDGVRPVACGFAEAKAEAVRRFEHDYLQRVLHEAGCNVTRAARLAGKERRAFGKLLKKHGIASHDCN